MSARHTELLTGVVAVAAVSAAGCIFDNRPTLTCECDGEEVDFSRVGEFAGKWKAPDGFSLDFDAQHQLRSNSGLMFGCGPLDFPLVLNAKNQSGGIDSHYRELIFAEVNPEHFDLIWDDDGSEYYEIFGEPGAVLKIWFVRSFDYPTELPDEALHELTRVSAEPAPTPKTPTCD